MPRKPRAGSDESILHVLNRANGDGVLFETAAQYREFLQIVADAVADRDLRLLAFCIMPNHWHFLLWARSMLDLSRFAHSVTLRHTRRWHARHGSAGRGHLYQGRYKSFLVIDDSYLLTVCRYIEQNPVRAGLVGRAEHWPWSSAAIRLAALGRDGDCPPSPVRLSPFPVALPEPLDVWLNELPPDAVTQAVRQSVRRSQSCDTSLVVDPATKRLLPKRQRGPA